MYSLVKRRSFLLYGLFGGLLAAAVYPLNYFIGIATAKRLLRPPGALEEPLFLARCTRCNLCLSSCPTGLLQPQNFSDGISAGTPTAVFARKTFFTKDIAVLSGKAIFTKNGGKLSYCEKDCVKCSQVCPTGAIPHFTKETKRNYKIGTAVFDFPNCLLYEDKECSICERECPYEAIEYVWSEKEYRKIVVIDKEKCTGCGRCVATCPVCIKNITLIKAENPLVIAPLETSS
jgi:ferredoxin